MSEQKIEQSTQEESDIIGSEPSVSLEQQFSVESEGSPSSLPLQEAVCSSFVDEAEQNRCLEQISFEEGSWNHFEQQLNAAKDVDAKLRITLTFMEGSIAQQSGVAQLRLFGEARKVCLPLFKENITAAVRAELWTKYTELTTEYKRLREMVNEQSAFAVEQIDLAIKDLENIIEQENQNLEAIAHMDLALFSKSIAAHYDFYDLRQQGLLLLNTYATRINSLRKELIKTEMRIKVKNQFFHRLSALGDKIFPKRKEYIKQISDQFLLHVEEFITIHFTTNGVQGLLFELREEIKQLQALAKVLTLNTSSFNSTRKKLSVCWDEVKEIEKKLKKQRHEKREIYREHQQQVQEQIDALKSDIENLKESLTPTQIQVRLKGITSAINKIELGFAERKELFVAVDLIRLQLNEHLEQEQKSRQTAEERELRLKQEQFQHVQQIVRQLLQQAKQWEGQQIEEEKQKVLDVILQATLLSKAEKQNFEKQLKTLRDLISEKKTKALLSLSGSDQQVFVQLQELLTEKIKLRKESKAQFDTYRKVRGGSGLDFEQSLNYQNLIKEEKEKIGQLDLVIKEIEQKIASI